ncbi:hypothetical protein ACLB2K_029903 [Fragaria x ananassa]
MEKDHCVTQLVYGNSEFNVDGLNNFVKEVKLAGPGVSSYVVVAIMGPQSSGKSTLLNNLFQTKFREMDAEIGRSQTTQGIWMAKCVDIDPFTIAMDLEGSDGRERGQDDTAFEKQSALFALAIADIVMINMWCHEIGREQAANKPLLRTVFQAMMRIFGHNRKTTLLFVLRDKSKTPVEKLKAVLLEDIQKIWDEVPKRAAHTYTLLNQIFRVEVVALSSYEREEEKFKEEVAELRSQFFNSTAPRGLAGDRKGNVPASAFSLSAQNVWEAIKKDRDLDLPTHKVMLANVRCEEILNDKLNKFPHHKGWLQLKEAAETGLVPGLGKELSNILASCLHQYESETEDFDETVRKSKREVLKSKVLYVLYPAFISMLAHLRRKVFEDFKVRLNASITNGDDLFECVRVLTEDAICELNKGRAEAGIKNVHWDASTVRDKLRSDIEAYSNSIYNENIITDLKNLNLQNEEKSREQINKIVQMNEANQKAAQAQIDRLVELHAKDQEQLNMLVKLRDTDQREAQEQYNKLQASMENYKVELAERSRWGPFYFIRQLFSAFDDNDY